MAVHLRGAGDLMEGITPSAPVSDIRSLVPGINSADIEGLL